MKKIVNYVASFALSALPLAAMHYPSYDLVDNNVFINNLATRYQWNNNNGYCGETALAIAGLYYGQYISQYDVRATVCRSQSIGQILLGFNDLRCTQKLHLSAVEWNTSKELSTDQFLLWVKQHVLKGHPVAIGVFTNEYLFYGKTSPNAGDKEYDHIVPVYGVGSNHCLGDANYYGEDLIYFSDNGLWGTPTHPPYNFCYSFDAFQATRAEANDPNGTVYALSTNGNNYGIAITGVMDIDHDTLPIHITVNTPTEFPEIIDKSNKRPAPTLITLTLKIENLRPGEEYILYKYNDLKNVPHSHFNAQADKAEEHTHFIPTNRTYVMSEHIFSDQTCIYRCVKVSAP